MKRRDLMVALSVLGLTRIASAAQQKAKVWRIGFLHLSTEAVPAAGLDAFKQAFRDLGYVEGRDYVLERRFAENHGERLPALAAELVRTRPDLIMTVLATPTLAARQATSTIPIVMVGAGDPVGSGLVQTLARPGGNVTGVSNSLTDIAPKHLDVLHEIVPGASRIAVLMNPKYQSHRAALKTLQALAPGIRMEILPIEAESAQEIDEGFAFMARKNAQAVIVVPDSIYVERQYQIAELAQRNKLPCAGYTSAFADAGFLFGYGPNALDIYRSAAVYVKKILNGAMPADLPVEQPTKFELVINMRTVKALGLNIPQSLLVRADRIIE